MVARSSSSNQSRSGSQMAIPKRAKPHGQSNTSSDVAAPQQAHFHGQGGEAVLAVVFQQVGVPLGVYRGTAVWAADPFQVVAAVDGGLGSSPVDGRASAIEAAVDYVRSVLDLLEPALDGW